MKRTAVSRFVCVTVLTTALLSFGTANAIGEQGIDLNALIRDTQKIFQEEEKLTYVWWMPLEFWRASISQGAGIQLTGTQINEVVDPFRPYMIFGIVDGKMGPFAGVQYESKERIHSRLRLFDEKGKWYSPLPDSEVSPDIVNILAMMKPALENMIGPMGKNLHFFIFPANDKKGRLIADATAEGSFRITLGEESFQWRLPLGSLLAPKGCPACGEKLSGAYKFCPYDGTKLSTDIKFPGIQSDDAGAHSSPDTVDGDINSDLLEAAKAGDTAKVEKLLKKGADVNAKTEKGTTALMFAASGGHAETVKVLMEAGADVNAKTPKGTTARMYAEAKGHTETTKALIEAGTEGSEEPLAAHFRIDVPIIEDMPTTPKRVHYVAPEYPLEAKKVGLEGNVLLEVIVDEKGNVVDVAVVQGGPLGMTEKAVEAVWKWKYEPSTLHGRPISLQFKVNVRFTLQ